MRHIEANNRRDLGRILFHHIDSRDIWLALDDGAHECSPLNRSLRYEHLERLQLHEAVQYQQQLFFWRINPLLWSLSRAVVTHVTRQLKPDN